MINIGNIFGRWKTLKQVSGQSWLCVCSCGTQKKVNSSNLKSGRSRSCGCLKIEKAFQPLKHGHCHANHSSRTYNSWASMWQRCRNFNEPTYNYYGGRGITVDERWNDFKNFLADMGERPLKHTLDRIDPDGHYTPSNCRWATPSEQTLNRSSRNKKEKYNARI